MRFIFPFVFGLSTTILGFAAGRYLFPHTPASAVSDGESSGGGGRKAASGMPAAKGEGSGSRTGPKLSAAEESARRDITHAAQSALGETLESKRLGDWIRSIDQMTTADAPAIFEMLRREAGNGRGYPTETTYFWQTWTSKDPGAAWAFATAREEEGGRDGAEAILKTWAMQDPDKAGAVMAELEDTPLAREALKGLMHGLAESTHEEAVKFASTRLPQDLWAEASIHIAGSMIGRLGNQKVQDWFDSLPAETPVVFRKESAGVILESLRKSAPGEVEKFAIARLDQPWMGDVEQLSYIADMIRRNDSSPFNFVAEAIQHYPELAADRLVLQTVARGSADQVTAWIEANPEHPSADSIITGAARLQVMRKNPQAAEALLDRLHDQSLRAAFGQNP